MLTKVIEQAKIDRFARWMGHAERIVIVAHVAPDGDAIGSDRWNCAAMLSSVTS